MLSPKLAGKIILGVLSLVVMFHLSIVIGIVPYEFVWGGKLASYGDMCIMETVSISLNIFMIIIVALRLEYLKWNWPVKLLQVFLWIFASLFALNTVGNLFAETMMETLIFTPLTLVLSFLFFRLAAAKSD